jgi:8-oxoguanine deaminase
MTSLLARHAEVLVTMDDERREILDGAVLVEDGMITAVGPTADLPSEADTVLDMGGQIVLPGMVNTHHHLDQTLTRNLPQAQNINLFPWLRAHYGIWAGRSCCRAW